VAKKSVNRGPIAFEEESESFSASFKLSKREYDVVLTLINNVTNSEEIAKKLEISTHTVNNHLKSIFEKTDTKSKTEVLACFLNFAALRMQRDKLFARRPRVLIIDDEPSICEYVKEGLEERGLKVYTSLNPGEAIRLIGELNIDVILCDVRMPDVNGMVLLRELRQKHQYWPYFIFMTGFADFSVEESLHAGASGYIEKPVELERLFNMIMENLAEYGSEKIKALSTKEAKTITINGKCRLKSSDMGFGGAFVALDKKTGKNSKITVGSIIEMTLAPEKLVRDIRVQARVVWQRSEEKEGLPPGIGVKFIGMADDDRDVLMEYIRNHNISSFIPEGNRLLA
jgi:DNA-binding NarL/FixJ family response regulator